MSSMYPTASELFSVGRRAVVTTPNTKLNPATADVPGSNINIAIGTSAILGQEIIARGANAMRGAFIDSARGSALDRVCFDRTGLLRFSATPATWDVSLSRPLPGVAFSLTYDAGSRITAPDGTQFGTNADAVLGDFDTTVTVSVTALQPGEAGNLPGNTLLAFVDQPADTTLIVSPALDLTGTPVGAAGGTEDESDIQFIGRTRGFFPTLRRGVIGAIEFGALQVEGVAVATASEVLNPNNGFPAAYIQLVIGDRNGNASSVMIQSVIDKLIEFRAAGIPVQVVGGTVTFVPVSWSIGVLTGFDESLAVARVRAVTVAFASFLPPGPNTGTLYRSGLIAVAKSVPGVVVRDNSLAFPVTDVVPSSPTEMLRIKPASITFS
jgi:uncharacterized phage protein gp47/JayE